MSPQQRRNLQIVLIAATVLLLSACSAPKQLGNPQLPYPPTAPPEVGQIIHLPTGILVSEQQMLNIAAANRIVYVGETHDNPASHRLQLTVLEAMAKRHPGKVALGMEMFTPAQNEALQKWISGDSSEKEFLKEAGWFKVWKGDFDYYRDILYFTRENNIPVIGLNANKKTVRLVVANKLDELSPEENKIIPEMDLNDPYQRGLVEGIYGGHVKSEGMLDGFHRAQTLWDETMAESIVNFLSKEENDGFHMVVVAGGNHVRYGFGIPRRVFRRQPLSYTLIGGKEIEIPESKKDQLMDVTLPGLPMTPYGFMVFLRYEELEKEEVKLGVMMDEEDGLVIIKGIAPDSNAERAGLLENDIIISFDGETVSDTFDIVYAIKQKKAGDRGKVAIKRGNEVLVFDLEFLKQEKTHHGKQ